MLYRSRNERKLRLYVFQCGLCSIFEAYSPELHPVCLAGRVHIKIKHLGEGVDMEQWEKDLLQADTMFNSHAKVCRVCSGDGPDCCEIGERLMVLVNDALDAGISLERKQAQTSIPQYWINRKRIGNA